MERVDYDALLYEYYKLDTEKKLISNKGEYNEKNRLVLLEEELLRSGMLQDWEQLNNLLRKMEIRGYPYSKERNELETFSAHFTDGYMFECLINSGGSGYRNDYYGLKVQYANDNITYYQRSDGYGSKREIKDIFALKSDHPYQARLLTKIKLIKEFMMAYPIYREFKLKEVHEKMKEVRNKNKELKKELKIKEKEVKEKMPAF